MTGLERRELREGAAGFALRRGELALTLPDSVDSPRGADGFTHEDALLDALAATGPREWSEPQTQGVRAALFQRLASLGDGLIRVSEHDPHPLDWETADAPRAAYTAIPGSLNTPQARLVPERPQPPGRWHEVM
ncbi:hypothetical protein [Streptomyces yaizuensis]|uniref:Uncharacterized protein n=1 Tax=Streptomyces yaizuensis TaxID=2989713 RepID=A0ABQ5P6X9_9ACTN|nr:hypothetical protein [Streptomyces sp. YSPA8]GLF98243.1 hypothetical protein SYYSPA8_28120 [Streptomyces sp. YSPA8]